MSPGASVIIVTYNSTATISSCLASVISTLGPDDDALVIDNASTDRTLEVIAKLALPCNVRVLPQDTNLGFSKACNLGIANSAKEYIILLNPDTEVFGPWIDRLTTHFHLYKRTGAVGPLSNATIPNQHVTTYVSDYHELAQNGVALLEKLDQRYAGRSIPSKLLIGFCLALRRDLVEAYGGLDEDIFCGDDDLEMSWRLREKGYMLRVALDVFVNHHHHTSFNTLTKTDGDKIIQQGSDVLFKKMSDYYFPDRVPNPRDYFGISWWRPSILEEKHEAEVFGPLVEKQTYDRIFLDVQSLLRLRQHAQAVEKLQAAVKFFVNDFKLWYLLGSVYFSIRAYKEAEVALKNAWSLEFNDHKALQKLEILRNHETKLARNALTQVI